MRSAASSRCIRFSRSSLGVGGREVVETSHHFHVLATGQVVVHGGELAGETDVIASCNRVFADVDACHFGVSRVCFQQRGEHPDQRGLAGTVGTEQSVHDAGLELEAHIVERAHSVTERLDDIFDAYDRSVHAGSSLPIIRT